MSFGRPDAIIVLPHPRVIADPGLVASPLLHDRAKHLHASEAVGLFAPSVDPEGVFQSLGYSEPDIDAVTSAARVSSKHWVKLPNLGGYVAYGQRDELNLEPLVDKMGDEYVVLRDYPVYQRNDEKINNAGSASPNWPQLSGIDRAHGLKMFGRQIRFGIVDTGVDADHVEFARRRIPFAFVPHRSGVPIVENRRGFDPYGHGTHIASLIAGKKMGICSDARLCVASVVDGHSLVSHMSRIIIALDWLLGELIESQTQGYPIILNLSLGVPHEPPSHFDRQEYEDHIAALESAIIAFTDGGALVVAAIGNDGRGRYRLPAGLRHVLAVGAADELGDQVLRFSGNVPPGGRPDHAGPDMLGFGQGLAGAHGRTVAGNSTYVTTSGTSQATAYVSGIAGLYWSMDTRMTAEQVRQILQDTAHRPDSYERERWGQGLARFNPPKHMLDAWRASRKAASR